MCSRLFALFCGERFCGRLENGEIHIIPTKFPAVPSINLSPGVVDAVSSAKGVWGLITLYLCVGVCKCVLKRETGVGEIMSQTSSRWAFVDAHGDGGMYIYISWQYHHLTACEVPTILVLNLLCTGG